MMWPLSSVHAVWHRKQIVNVTKQPDAVSPPKKVLVVDDHAVVRKGLAMLINQENDLVVCGEAEDEQSALAAVLQLQPDVAVVDWSLKDKDAADMIVTFRQQRPQMPVLVLSIHEELLYAERALRAGARGYVMKQEAAGRIVDAIRRVAAGKTYLSASAASAISTSGLDEFVRGNTD
jgi:DNA-binding NarL/FixJ family response regulator